MLRKIKNWFSKNEDELEMRVQLPRDEEVKFILMVDDIRIGVLYCQKGEWYFKYTDDFKEHTDEYKLITGFPDLSKTYQSETLWPFFQIRIPGLKQPAIKEILEKEKIDKENEVALLKRFGRKTIANPYELIIA
ncbi:MAG: HipA N-terminal domain-containing protein [Chitinophagaceae bacterium]|nr:HipA N-terminal domain-containing protein [Chitinophagaceae bacterium]